MIDTANVLNNVANPKTGESNPIGTISIITILSVATLAVASKKRSLR